MSMESEYRELLFSYGTLQQKEVQLAQFGRVLDGSRDRLPCYRQGSVEITDPAVLAKSGKAQHPIAQHTGDPADTLDGMVFQLSGDELAAADRYEVNDYRRVAVRLSSGAAAWAYVAGDQAPAVE
jgi:gamma-glutamylcyclotransferase (GGCT)/AIG2-like uncharacterized protein YtfP